jgi:hypothetical protein
MRGSSLPPLSTLPVRGPGITFERLPRRPCTEMRSISHARGDDPALLGRALEYDVMCSNDAYEVAQDKLRARPDLACLNPPNCP